MKNYSKRDECNEEMIIKTDCYDNNCYYNCILYEINVITIVAIKY